MGFKRKKMAQFEFYEGFYTIAGLLSKRKKVDTLGLRRAVKRDGFIKKLC